MLGIFLRNCQKEPGQMGFVFSFTIVFIRCFLLKSALDNTRRTYCTPATGREFPKTPSVLLPQLRSSETSFRTSRQTQSSKSQLVLFRYQTQSSRHALYVSARDSRVRLPSSAHPPTLKAKESTPFTETLCPKG